MFSVTLLFYSTLKSSAQALEDINNTCDEKGLPPAFKINAGFLIKDNTDYSLFKGFGIAISGLLPAHKMKRHLRPHPNFDVLYLS